MNRDPGGVEDDHALIDVIHSSVVQALEAWRKQQWARFADFLEDGVEFLSPYAGDEVLMGKAAVLTHLAERSSESQDRELIDILLGVRSFTILMRDGVGFKSAFMETGVTGLIARMQISFSAGASKLRG